MKILHRLVSRITGDLSCEEVNSFLAAYVDWELDEETKVRFERHISRCVNCRRYLEQYRLSVQLAHEGGIRPIPEELVSSTIAFLREQM